MDANEGHFGRSMLTENRPGKSSFTCQSTARASARRTDNTTSARPRQSTSVTRLVCSHGALTVVIARQDKRSVTYDECFADWRYRNLPHVHTKPLIQANRILTTPISTNFTATGEKISTKCHSTPIYFPLHAVFLSPGIYSLFSGYFVCGGNLLK